MRREAPGEARQSESEGGTDGPYDEFGESIG